MLYIITENTTWTLRFLDRDGSEVDRWTIESDLETALYAACAEWCENFKKVEVSDSDCHLCTMYDDGSIELMATGIQVRGGMQALLD